MPAMEIPKAKADSLEELVNYMARQMVRPEGWGSARKHGTMYLLAYSMNQQVIDLKRNIQQREGYWIYPPGKPLIPEKKKKYKVGKASRGI